MDWLDMSPTKARVAKANARMSFLLSDFSSVP
jgi:hypothetical protein